MDAEALNEAVAVEIFGVDQDALKRWRWPLPDFATDRGWSAAVVSELGGRDDPVRLAFERNLTEFADFMRVKGGFVEAMILLTPDEICRAALKAVRQQGESASTDPEPSKNLLSSGASPSHQHGEHLLPPCRDNSHLPLSRKRGGDWILRTHQVLSLCSQRGLPMPSESDLPDFHDPSLSPERWVDEYEGRLDEQKVMSATAAKAIRALNTIPDMPVSARRSTPKKGNWWCRLQALFRGR